MLNNVVLVGRLTKDPVLVELKDGMKVCNISLAVNRPFRELDTGEYGVDFIPISLWNGISKTIYEYCRKGDTVAVKGRVHMKVKEENGQNKYSLEIIGEHVSFIQIKNKKVVEKKLDEELDYSDIQEDEE